MSVNLNTKTHEFDSFCSKLPEKEKTDELLYFPALLKAIETGNTNMIDHIAIDLEKQYLITAGNAFEAAISANQYSSLTKLIELGANLFTESEITPLDRALDKTFPLSLFTDEDFEEQVRRTDTRIIKLLASINPVYHEDEVVKACMDIVFTQMNEQALTARDSLAAKSTAVFTVLEDELPLDIHPLIFQYALEEEEELFLDRYRATNAQIGPGTKSIHAKGNELDAVLSQLPEDSRNTILIYSIEGQEEIAYHAQVE